MTYQREDKRDTYTRMVLSYKNKLKKKRPGVSETFHKSVCKMESEKEFGKELKDKDL